LPFRHSCYKINNVNNENALQPLTEGSVNSLLPLQLDNGPENPNFICKSKTIPVDVIRHSSSAQLSRIRETSFTSFGAGPSGLNSAQKKAAVQNIIGFESDGSDSSEDGETNVYPVTPYPSSSNQNLDATIDMTDGVKEYTQTINVTYTNPKVISIKDNGTDNIELEEISIIHKNETEGIKFTENSIKDKAKKNTSRFSITVQEDKILMCPAYKGEDDSVLTNGDDRPLATVVSIEYPESEPQEICTSDTFALAEGTCCTKL